MPSIEVNDSYPERGAAFWLPPTGYGNGLPSTAWAQIVDLPARLTRPVLTALTAAGIPAHLDLRHDPARIGDGSPRVYHLRVDAHRYSEAEDLLMDLMRADRNRRAADRRTSPSGHRAP